MLFTTLNFGHQFRCQAIAASTVAMALFASMGDSTRAAGVLTLDRGSSIPPISDLTPVDGVELVIRLSDRRVYLYRHGELQTSYPIAIGRTGWDTPTGRFAVRQMVIDPAWKHPWTGEVVPPGVDNPLGVRWIGFWSDGTNAIGFHGTPDESLIGQAVSHGCVRMRNADVVALFEQVSVGTPVVVQP